jgi:hypothetical protein
LPELDRLIKKFVRVLAHDGFGQPSRNPTDNELCRKSSRGAPVAGVTSQIKSLVQLFF